MKTPGFFDLIQCTPGSPTPESSQLEAVMETIWHEVSAGVDVTQAYAINLRVRRHRRTWRGRQFSYCDPPLLVAKNVRREDMLIR